MKKLHEILAVINDKENQVGAICTETENTFTNKRELFFEAHKTLQMFDAEESIDTPDEHLAMAGTIPDKMDYFAATVGDLYDLLLQQETANQAAKADLIVDGVTIAAGLPATFLLNMEKRLAKVRNIYLKIPTLPTGKEWELDPEKGKYVYRSKHPEKQFRTRKDIQFKVIVQPTKEHPAQVEKWNDTKDVGLYTKNMWCSMLTSADKSEVLSRVDKLIAAVKQARQRANSTEVRTDTKIGKDLFNYIHGGVV